MLLVADAERDALNVVDLVTDAPSLLRLAEKLEVRDIVNEGVFESVTSSEELSDADCVMERELVPLTEAEREADDSFENVGLRVFDGVCDSDGVFDSVGSFELVTLSENVWLGLELEASVLRVTLRDGSDDEL